MHDFNKNLIAELRDCKIASLSFIERELDFE